MEINISEGLAHKFKDDIHYLYFNDASKLYLEGFQFLKAATSNYLLECYHLEHNGKLKLIYDTREYRRPFIENRKMTFEEVLVALCKLSEAIHQAFEEHYIKKEGLILNLDHIYEDAKGDIKLLYVPISDKSKWEESSVKKALMKDLIQFLKVYNDLESPFLAILRRELMSDVDRIFKVIRNLSFKEGVVCYENVPYYEYECSKTNGSESKSEISESSKNSLFSFLKKSKITSTIKEPIQKKSILKLKSSDGKIGFEINQKSFVVGSLPPDQVDGSLLGYKGISRKHFEIIENGAGEYWITDLYSTNGTKLNKELLKASLPEKLKSGDIIEVLNLKFFVNIEVV